MKPLLADTSVWRRHLAGGKGVERLRDSLDEVGSLLVHPWVIAELVLGGMSAGAEGLLYRLPRAQVIPDREVLEFVRARKLQQRGVGWVDVHLLASAVVEGACLWTFDKDLDQAAARLGCAIR